MHRLITLGALLVTLFASIHPAPALALDSSFNVSGCHGNAQNPGLSGNQVFVRIYNGGPQCDAAETGVGFKLALEQKVGGVWTHIGWGTYQATPNAGFNNVNAVYFNCGNSTPALEANPKSYRTVVYAHDTDGYEGSPPILDQPFADSSSYDWPRNCANPS